MTPNSWENMASKRNDFNREFPVRLPMSRIVNSEPPPRIGLVNNVATSVTNAG